MNDYKLRMDPTFQVILTTKMLDAGIVPISGNPLSFASESDRARMKQMMSSLTPAERRRAARKFRKLWRKQEKMMIRQVEDAKSGALLFTTQSRLKDMRKMKAGCDPRNPEPTSVAVAARARSIALAFEREVELELQNDSLER